MNIELKGKFLLKLLGALIEYDFSSNPTQVASCATAKLHNSYAATSVHFEVKRSLRIFPTWAANV